MKVYDDSMSVPLIKKGPRRDRHDDNTIEMAPRTPDHRYNPFTTPPDFEMALNHGKAKRVCRAKPKDLTVSLVKRICPCCGIEIEGDQLPMSTKLSELYHLGSGYALYFRSVKFGIVLLAIMFVISGIFNVVSNAQEGDCSVSADDIDDDYCVQDRIMTYTIANKRNNTHMLTIQTILNLVTVIIIPIFFQFFYYRIRRTTIEADELTITPSDFSIKVTGITPEADDKAIQHWVEGLAYNGYLKCTKINRTYDISKYVDLHKKKDILTTKKSETLDHVEKLVVQNDIDEIDKELETLKHQELQRTNIIFISFQEAQQAQYLIEEYKKALVGKWCAGLTSCFSHNLQEFNGQHVSIKRAPEPTDIIWENQGFDRMEKVKRIITSELISAVVIIICFLLVVLIGWGQNVVREKIGENSSLIPFLSAVASYLVVTVNYILYMATRYLSGREKHETYTAFFTSVARRLSASMFINTAFTAAIAKIVTLASFGEINNVEESLDAFNLYRRNGVLENMFYIFLSNAIVGPIYTMLNPFHFLKLHKRKKALEQGERSTMTQQKAHLTFEGIETDLSFRNAALAKTILVTAFFAPAMPLVLLISIAGLILSYWSDKYSLLRRSALPASLDHTLSNHMIRIFELSGFMFALGNLVFMLTLQNSVGRHDYFVVPYGVIIATLIISVVYFFIPRRRINAVLFPLPEEAETNRTYDDARVDFPSDYDIENPMTKREGLHEYVEFLRHKTRNNSVAVSMHASMKKGGFHSMFQNNLRELVTADIGMETAQIRKRNDMVFLDEYASRNPNVSILMKRSNRERSVGIDQLIRPGQNFHSGS